MRVRQDLQRVAEKLAETAREAADTGKPITYESVRMAGLADGAKAALEAAALVDVDPAPIMAAIDDFYTVAFPDDDVVTDGDPAADIREIARLIVHHRGRRRIAAAIEGGYDRLTQLLRGLERDFAASDTPTAQRITARIHMGLQEAEQAIKQATNTETEEV